MQVRVLVSIISHLFCKHLSKVQHPDLEMETGGDGNRWRWMHACGKERESKREKLQKKQSAHYFLLTRRQAF